MFRTILVTSIVVSVVFLSGCTLTPHHAVGKNNLEYLRSSKVEELDRGLFGADWRPIHVAAQQGNIEALRILVEKGVDINVRTRFGQYNGETALNLALLNNQTTAARFLIDSGAILNLGNINGVRALEIATVNKDFDMVQYILNKGANPNNSNINKVTPLFVAVQNGSFDILKLLVSFGADVNYKSSNRSTPLFENVIISGNKKILEFLIENGADVNFKNEMGDTALHWAVGKNDLEKVSILLSAGADPNIVSNLGYSPLQIATVNNNPKIVKELLRVNPVVNIRGANLITPLHEAAFVGNAEIVQMLLNAGASVSSQDQRGFNAIQYADFQGHHQVVNLLVKNGADPNFQKIHIQSPQQQVAQNDQTGSDNSHLWTAAIVGLVNAVGNYYGAKSGYVPVPVTYTPPAPQPKRQPLQYQPIQQQTSSIAPVNSKPVQVVQPLYSAPSTTSGCVSDFECGGTLKCVKPPMSSTGQCVQPVNSIGVPVNTLPNPASSLPNLNIQGQCQFNTQCSVGFKCDQNLKVCVKD